MHARYIDGMSTPPTLDYSPTRPGHFRRNRWRYGAIIALIVGAMVVYPFLRPARVKITSLYWQSRCLRFEMPADERARSPECWKRYLSFHLYEPGFLDASFPDGSRVVFLHEMETSSGKRRLVLIHRWLDLAVPLHLAFAGGVIEPETLVSPPHVMTTFGRGNFMGGRHPIAIYFGQLDPKDHSHVVFRVRSDPSIYPSRLNTVVDGFLHDDDTMTFKYRDLATTQGL